MSKDASDGRKPGEWVRLEKTLASLIEQSDGYRAQLTAARKRIAELEQAVEDVAGGRLDPVALSERASAAERENRKLTKKLDQAHETVQRILGRLQFLEEDR